MRISDWSSDVCSSDLAGDDDTLIRVVAAAHKAGTPDPVSYITKALAGSQERTEKVAALQKAEWSLLGWEPPKYVAGKPRFTGAVRGPVWRDPYGKLSTLPAADKTIPAPPTSEERAVGKEWVSK